MLNSNLQDTRDLIAKEANEWGITVPILVDDTQLIGESLNLSRTAEVLIIDPKKLEIIYRGPLSDRIDYEVQKDKAAKAYAFIKRRGYVIPEDVRAVCKDVLRHRIGLSYEAEAENVTTVDIITEILNRVEIP